REDRRAARHPRSRGSHRALGRRLSPVARPARPHHAPLRRAAAPPARSRARQDASGLRAAPGKALERPVARSGHERGRGGGGEGARRMMSDPKYAWLRQLTAFIVLLLIWEAAGRAGYLNPLYMPTPLQIWGALVELFGGGSIWPHMYATFSAALAGLALGIVVVIVLGVLAALIRPVAELLEPVMLLLNAIPRVILAP